MASMNQFAKFLAESGLLSNSEQAASQAAQQLLRARQQAPPPQATTFVPRVVAPRVQAAPVGMPRPAVQAPPAVTPEMSRSAQMLLGQIMGVGRQAPSDAPRRSTALEAVSGGNSTSTPRMMRFQDAPPEDEEPEWATPPEGSVYSAEQWAAMPDEEKRKRYEIETGREATGGSVSTDAAVVDQEAYRGQEDERNRQAAQAKMDAYANPQAQAGKAAADARPKVWTPVEAPIGSVNQMSAGSDGSERFRRAVGNVGMDRPTVVGDNVDPEARLRREEDWRLKESRAAERESIPWSNPIADAEMDARIRYERDIVQPQLDRERQNLVGIGQGRPEVVGSLAEDPNRTVVDANTPPPPGIGETTYYTLELPERQALWDQHSQSVTRGDTKPGESQAPTSDTAWQRASMYDGQKLFRETRDIVAGTGETIPGEVAEFAEASYDGDNSAISFSPTKDLITGPVKDGVMWAMNALDAGRQYNAENVGQNIIYAATHNGSGADDFWIDSPMVRWVRNRPETWSKIRAIDEFGYTSPSGETFTGDRAAWEWWIGQQSMGERIFYDSVMDPSNWAVGASGVGQSLIRKGADIFVTDEVLGQALMTIGKLMVAPQRGMDLTVDAIPNLLVEALGDAVGAIPGVRNIKRIPDWLTADSPDAARIAGTERVEEMDRLARERAGAGRFDPQQPLPETGPRRGGGANRKGQGPIDDSGGGPGRTGNNPDFGPDPNEPIPQPGGSADVEARNAQRRAYDADQPRAAAGVSTRRNMTPEDIADDERAVAAAREQRRRAEYDQSVAMAPAVPEDVVARDQARRAADVEQRRRSAYDAANPPVAPKAPEEVVQPPLAPARVDAPNEPVADEWGTPEGRRENRDRATRARTADKEEIIRQREERVRQEDAGRSRYTPPDTFDEALPPVEVPDRAVYDGPDMPWQAAPDVEVPGVAARATPDPWRDGDPRLGWKKVATLEQRNGLKKAGYSLPDENLGFIDPSYRPITRDLNQPSLSEQVAFIEGVKDPAKGAAYWADITPVFREHAAADRALRGGKGAWFPGERTGQGVDSAERVLGRVKFDADQERIYSSHFDTPPTDYPFHTDAPVGVRAMEHAVFGDATTAPAAQDWLLDPAKNTDVRFVGGRPIEDVVEELRATRASLGMEQAPVTETTPGPMPSTADDATPEVPFDTPSPDAPSAPASSAPAFRDDPYPEMPPEPVWAANGDAAAQDAYIAAVRQNEAALRELAVHGTPDSVVGKGKARVRTQGTAGRARKDLRKALGAADVNRLSDERQMLHGLADTRYGTSGYARNTHHKGTRYEGGIDNDIPSAEAAGFSSWDSAKGRRIAQAKAHRRKINDAIEERLGVPVMDDAPAAPGTSWATQGYNEGRLSRGQMDDLQEVRTIKAGAKVKIEQPDGTFKTTTVKTDIVASFEQRVDQNLAALRDADARRLKTEAAARKRNVNQQAVANEQGITPAGPRSQADMLDEAVTKTTAEFTTLYAKDPSKMPKGLQKMGSAHRIMTKLIRENLQFNVASGVSAANQDTIGNAWTAFITGNGGALKDVLQTAVKGARKNDEDFLYHEVVTVARESKKLGIDTPKKYIDNNVGREQVDRRDLLYTERLGNAVGGPMKPIAGMVASKKIKNLRQWMDSAFRVSVFHNHVNKNVAVSRVKFLKSADALAEKLGIPELSEQARGLGRRFDADDVREMTRGLGLTDDTLARQWKRETTNLASRAQKETDRVYFTYRQTNADAAISKVFMFHYYMTRATALHAKTALQHPGLLNAYAEMWEYTEENTDPNAPAWMNGYIGFMRDVGGAAGFLDPLSVILPLTMFRDSAGDFEERGFDKVMGATRLFPSPLIQAAAVAVGWSGKPADFLGTPSLRGAVKSVLDYARNHGMDLGFGPGLTPDPYANIQQRINNTVSEIAASVGGGGIPFSEPSNFPDPDDVELGKLRGIVTTLFVEEYGEMSTWDQETWGEYYQMGYDIADGKYDHPLVEEALDRHTEIELAQDVANSVFPADVRIRDQRNDERSRLTNEGYDKAEEDRSPEERAAIDETNAKSNLTGEPAAILLAGEVAQYDSIGTENQKALGKGYNRIAYDEDIPPTAFMDIGGVTYTGEQVNAMTYDERVALADEWVAEWEGENPGEPKYAPYKEERDAFKAQHTELSNYTTYKSWVYDYNTKPDGTVGGPREFRNEIEAKMPDSEFSRAIAAQRKNLTRQDIEGEELEERLDSWTASDEGYNAIMGVQSKGGTKTGDVVYDKPGEEPWIQVESSDTKYGTKGEDGEYTGDKDVHYDSKTKTYVDRKGNYVSPWAHMP